MLTFIAKSHTFTHACVYQLSLRWIYKPIKYSRWVKSMITNTTIEWFIVCMKLDSTHGRHTARQGQNHYKFRYDFFQQIPLCTFINRVCSIYQILLVWWHSNLHTIILGSSLKKFKAWSQLKPYLCLKINWFYWGCKKKACWIFLPKHVPIWMPNTYL